MKRLLVQLEVGDLIAAELTEHLPDGEWICSFAGDLLRVRNRSGRLWKKGDLIRLQVVATNPFEFRVSDSKSVRMDRFA